MLRAIVFIEYAVLTRNTNLQNKNYSAEPFLSSIINLEKIFLRNISDATFSKKRKSSDRKFLYPIQSGHKTLLFEVFFCRKIQLVYSFYLTTSPTKQIELFFLRNMRHIKNVHKHDRDFAGTLKMFRHSVPK